MAATACSSEKTDAPVRLEQLVEDSIEVPEDGTDFQAEASIDAAGKITGRRVTLDPGMQVLEGEPLAVSKPIEIPGPPPTKIAPSLTEKLAPEDPNARTKVLVGVAHDAPFHTLTKLKRELPRESTANDERLASRVSEIAAVDALRKPLRAEIIEFARSLGGTLIEEFTFGNAVEINLPDSAIERLAAHPKVVSISAAEDSMPLPSKISDGTSLATGMNSVFWRPGNDGNLGAFYAVTFDSGIRSTHMIFNSPDGGFLGSGVDCAHGNSSCANSPPNPNYFTQDNTANSHGTAVANIILGGNFNSVDFGSQFIGVSRVHLDYMNISNNGGSVGSAILRAFALAPLWFDDLIIAEVQHAVGEGDPLSTAADDAFDAGLAVIAACGNIGAVTSPASPGNAHKAIAVGDHDAVTGVVGTQVPGNVGGRFKPDIQAPAWVDTASNFTDFSPRTDFSGTSAATAFAGGAATLMYEFYFNAFGITNAPGHLYTALIAQGDGGTMPGLPNGAGRLKMESGSNWWTGALTIGPSGIDVLVNIPAGRKNLKAAIWYPEGLNDAHNDIDLGVFSPAGTLLGASVWGSTVWEKFAQPGNLTAGTYKFRITPYNMPRPSQKVYYTIIAAYQ